MGYTVKRNTIRLVFEDHPTMEGAEVVCRSINLEKYFVIARLQIAGADEIEALITEFATDVLQEWNLKEEDGTEIPATKEGLMSLEPQMALDIIKAWVEGLVNVRAPLGESSSSGASLPEVSIPMETLSGNHQN